MIFKDNKKNILPIIITTVFWFIVFLLIIYFYSKKIIKSETKTAITPTPTTFTENKMTKLYEKGDISVYRSEPYTSGYKATISLERKGENNPYTISNDALYSGDGTEICDTDNSNTIVYNAKFYSRDLIYIDTKNNKIIRITTGDSNYGLVIDDQINSTFNSTIQASINNQCDNQNIGKAWVKDLLLNSYPQNIFPEEYEIECIKKGDLGKLVYFTYNGINKALNKIFFSYGTIKLGDNSTKDTSYSYDLINHKIKAEKSSDILKTYDCQYLESDGMTGMTRTTSKTDILK